MQRAHYSAACLLSADTKLRRPQFLAEKSFTITKSISFEGTQRLSSSNHPTVGQVANH